MTKFICKYCKGLISSKDCAGAKVKCGHCQETVLVVGNLENGFVIQDFIITKKEDENTYRLFLLTHAHSIFIFSNIITKISGNV